MFGAMLCYINFTQILHASWKIHETKIKPRILIRDI